MYERDIPIEYYTERGVEPPGLSFTGTDMAEWDDDDRESAKLAMEIDMHDRWRAQEERIAYLSMANANLLRQIELMEADRCGTCDECDTVYDVASREDHCAECGTCWDHCLTPWHSEEQP